MDADRVPSERAGERKQSRSSNEVTLNLRFYFKPTSDQGECCTSDNTRGRESVWFHDLVDTMSQDIVAARVSGSMT